MKKTMIALLMIMLWASLAMAQQAGDQPAQVPAAEAQAEVSKEVFDARVGLDYRGVTQKDNARAGEYEYLKSSGGGALDIEYDPLPHRFVLESYVLNQKDYYGSVDYSYRDVVLFNMYTRDLYHNLQHYRFGPDDTATTSISSTDKNPDDLYGLENKMRRAFIRFKTPDFPFHLYANIVTVDREGTIQQRFLRGYTGSLERVSQSREVDWNSQEVTVGMNSHLSYFEADYSHIEKKFQSLEDSVLVDSYTVPAMDVNHNSVPALKSSSDTIKIHTTFSGRFVASGTYSNGEKKNLDSDAKSNYANTAGDLTFTPFSRLVLFVKYRHYDLSTNNPDTITLSSLGTTYSVRDSLSSKRDLLSGIIRYRVTPRLTVKGEYAFDTTARNGLLNSGATTASTTDGWDVAARTTKVTGKGGLTYRILNKLMLRADYSSMQVENPAYTSDPDRSVNAKVSLTWSPIQQVTALLSYGGVREKRDYLSAPLAGGSRKSNRDQLLGSLTFLVGNSASLTASYMYYQNKNKGTITYEDGTGAYLLENGVPYADKSEVVSLSGTQALGEGLTLTAEASRSFSKGKFTTDGSVANTNGIAELSDLRVVDDIFSAGLEMQLSKTVNSELRYKQEHYDDRVDNTQDGKVSTMLATVSMKW